MSATPLNLNESNDGMTPLNQPPTMNTQQQQQIQKQPTPPHRNTEYIAEIPTEEKNNNNSTIQTTMDSTPLADILPPQGNEVMDMNPQDPRMVQAAPQQSAMMMMGQPQQQQQQPKQGGADPQKQNPMNLTDEQIEALFVGACAVIAFSKPVQEKLAGLIPQFTSEDGGRSAAGMAVTAMVAAFVFYFGRRMVINKL